MSKVLHRIRISEVDFPMGKRVKVAILKVDNFQDPYDTIEETVKLAGGFESIVSQ